MPIQHWREAGAGAATVAFYDYPKRRDRA